MEFAQLGQIALSFVFVIALMVGLAWLVKRLGLEQKWSMARSTSGMLSVIDSMFLGPRRRIMVIGYEARRYVVLLDGERAQVLDTLEGKH